MTATTVPTLEDLSAQIDALYGAEPTPRHVLDAALDVFAERMRALTVRQSWAGLIASVETLGDEAKTTENRRRYTRFTGPLLIHSAAAMGDMSQLPADFRRLLHRVPERLQACSRILAVARIAESHPYTPGCCESPWAERAARVWHWQIADVRALPEPIPAKGRLGLWKPSRDLVGQVLEQLAGASHA